MQRREDMLKTSFRFGVLVMAFNALFYLIYKYLQL